MNDSRSPKGCPWDREQTHASLKRNLIEESYEVLEAIDKGDPARLSEELGDILVQVAFHSQIAGEAGHFTVEDVVAKADDKLVRRHPHVFGDGQASDSHEVEMNWERLKEQEGGRTSPVEGIPKDLPALAHAQLMQDRVGRVGFEWPDISGVLDKLAEEVEELKNASDYQEKVSEMGDLLLAMVNLARWMDIHAEDALRQANLRFSEAIHQNGELGLGAAAATSGGYLWMKKRSSGRKPKALLARRDRPAPQSSLRLPV